MPQPHSIGQPYLVYMEDKDRLLLAVNPQTMLVFSDDHGGSWTDPHPAPADTDAALHLGNVRALSYLGKGELILGTDTSRWFSSDFGRTWGHPAPVAPASNGHEWHQWDPYLVDRGTSSGAVVRLAETGWNRAGGHWPQTPEQAVIRFSFDKGQTWNDEVAVPEWQGFNEVALCRASNGDIVAACRSHMPRWYAGRSDYYSGLGVSVSEDGGKTWSQVTMLYTFGRHHPCMIVAANGELVMTHVVRLGYPGDAEGFPQYGIEAVVSPDNGRTWDIGHHFVLNKWSGAVFRDAPQSTSSVILPDGWILTAYGTGYRTNKSDGTPYVRAAEAPHDIGLIKWRLP